MKKKEGRYFFGFLILTAVILGGWLLKFSGSRTRELEPSVFYETVIKARFLAGMDAADGQAGRLQEGLRRLFTEESADKTVMWQVILAVNESLEDGKVSREEADRIISILES